MSAFAKTSHRVALAALIVAGAAVSAAHAVTDTAFVYSPPKTGYYVIDSVDMIPGTGTLSYVNMFGIGLHPTTDTQLPVCFNAGVHLPHGARITQLAVSYKSGTETASLQPSIELFRKQISDNSMDQIAFANFNDDSNIHKVVNVPLNANATGIGNAAFAYGFHLCLAGPDDYFYSARISYVYSNAGD